MKAIIYTLPIGLFLVPSLLAQSWTFHYRVDTHSLCLGKYPYPANQRDWQCALPMAGKKYLDEPCRTLLYALSVVPTGAKAPIQRDYKESVWSMALYLSPNRSQTNSPKKMNKLHNRNTNKKDLTKLISLNSVRAFLLVSVGFSLIDLRQNINKRFSANVIILLSN